MLNISLSTLVARGLRFPAVIFVVGLLVLRVGFGRARATGSQHAPAAAGGYQRTVTMRHPKRLPSYLAPAQTGDLDELMIANGMHIRSRGRARGFGTEEARKWRSHRPAIRTPRPR